MQGLIHAESGKMLRRFYLNVEAVLRFSEIFWLFHSFWYDATYRPATVRIRKSFFEFPSLY